MRHPDDVVHVLLQWLPADFLAHGADGDAGAATLAAVQHAGVLDFAEHISSEFGGRIVVAANGPPEDSGREKGGWEWVADAGGTPVRRARRILEEAERGRKGRPVLLWVAPDPLYRIADLRRAVELLTCDEELLPLARRRGMPDDVAFAAFRSFHPEAFGAGETMLGLAALVQCDISPVPLRSAGPCCTTGDLPRYLHDIEREMLLDRWYPRRARQVVRRVLPSEEAM